MSTGPKDPSQLDLDLDLDPDVERFVLRARSSKTVPLARHWVLQNHWASRSLGSPS